MEWKWTVEAVIALAALFLSIFSVYKSCKASSLANNLTNESNMLTKGQVELQIREMISSAKYRYTEIGCKFLEDTKKAKDYANHFIEAAYEDVLNAYDEACTKYLDDKIDKERFKKTYYNEIKNLVECEDTKASYVPPQTRYKATLKVYNEWFDMES